MSRQMRAYFAKKSDAAMFARLVRASFADLKVFPPLELASKDWMKEWRKHYKTQVIKGGAFRLRIVPAWKKAPKGGVSIKIQPGQAFGTGTHATTRLCLSAFMENLDSIGDRFSLLDFGAGTGVLALGAMALASNTGKLAKALAVESDGEALKLCRKNAGLNRRKMSFSRKLPSAGKFDFIFANVLSPVLLAYRRELAKRLKPGGTLVLSGVLASEAGQFSKEFSVKGLKLRKTMIEGDWAAFILSAN